MFVVYAETLLQLGIIALSLYVICRNILAVKKYKADPVIPIALSFLAFHFVLFYSVYLGTHGLFTVAQDELMFRYWSLILRAHSVLSMFVVSHYYVNRWIKNRKEFTLLMERLRNENGSNNL